MGFPFFILKRQYIGILENPLFFHAVYQCNHMSSVGGRVIKITLMLNSFQQKSFCEVLTFCYSELTRFEDIQTSLPRFFLELHHSRICFNFNGTKTFLCSFTAKSFTTLRKPPTIRVSPSVGHFPLNHQSSCPIKGHPAKSFTTLRKPPTISVSPSVGQFPLNHQSRCPPRDTLSPKNQALPLKK